MRIYTLVENTAVSPELKSVHGLSFYIETEKHRLLFDVGPNELFLKNAGRMGVDISAVDTVVISHGHYDHGGALGLFFKKNDKAKVYIRENAFSQYYARILGIPQYVGLDAKLKDCGRFVTTGDGVFEIDDELTVFSGVTERECYASSNDALYEKVGQRLVRDSFSHEQSLIITEGEKKVLIAGCAHNGIVNILNRAEKLAGREMDAVISGMHLYNPVFKRSRCDRAVTGIGERILKSNSKFYTCHCTGPKAYEILRGMAGDRIGYLAAGSVLEI